MIIALLFAVLHLFDKTVYYSPELSSDGLFNFPASLTLIDDEAFSETAVKTVVLPDGFLHIGDRAFSNTAYLSDVYIPKTTEHIADSAFSECCGFTIHGVDGSYASRWAEKHHISFTSCDMWSKNNESGKRLIRLRVLIEQYIQLINTSVFVLIEKRKKDKVRSMRPQDRPELNPIDYRFP